MTRDIAWLCEHRGDRREGASVFPMPNGSVAHVSHDAIELGMCVAREALREWCVFLRLATGRAA